MIWNCIYIKDIKVKFDRAERVNLNILPGKRYYIVFKEIDSDYEYRVCVPKLTYNKYMKEGKDKDFTIIQNMIFKNGSEYKREIGFANRSAYDEYNELSESEKGFYEYNLNNIDSKCFEYEVNRVRNTYQSFVNISSLIMIFIVSLAINK